MPRTAPRRPRPRRIWTLLGTHHLEHAPADVILLLALGAALALTASVGVAWAAGFDRVAAHLRNPNLLWLPIALGGAVAAHLGYVLAYREVAYVESGPTIGFPRAGAIVATGFGAFVPRGGFALDLEALRDLGVPPREARIRVLGLGSLEYVVLATGAFVCSVLLLLRHSHVESALTLSWTIGVPAGTLLALLALRSRERISRGRAGALLGPALDALDVVGKILTRPRKHAALALAGMSAYWAGEVFVLWACYATFARHAPSVPALVLGYATGYALTRRTLPLAGAGAVEAVLPFALTWVGLAARAVRARGLRVPGLQRLAAGRSGRGGARRAPAPQRRREPRGGATGGRRSPSSRS